MGSVGRRIRLGAVTIVTALLLSAAPSVAGTVPALPTSPSPVTTAPTTPPAPAAKGALNLAFQGAFFVHHHALTVPKRRFTVQGTVRPYVAGQTVTVEAFVGHHLFKTATVALKPASNGASGTFALALESPRAGVVTVQAAHAATTAQVAYAAHETLTAYATKLHFGSRGRFVELIQARLAALHFYIRQTGVYDGGTGLAVDAYHRLLGRGVSQSLDPRTISYLLNGWGKFKVRDPHDGRHVEGDLQKQLLALINGASVYAIYPISSGKPSTPTVLGHFHVYLKVPGYYADGLYFPSFFFGNYAIHGYNPAPDYPASHGCMRLPIPDAISVFNWLQMGNVVDVYY
jgi:hypothetical protein